MKNCGRTRAQPENAAADVSVDELMNYAKQNEETLLELTRAGDERALDALLERYKNIVRLKARRYFLAGADREDILQEGMIGLYKAIRDYKPERQASFHLFAELCISRQIITAVKAAARQKHIPLNSYVSFNKPDDSGRAALDAASTRMQSDPEAVVIGREEHDAMLLSIEEYLSRYERQVLDHYLAGRSYRQIAFIMGKSEKSIDNALQRIKRKLSERR